MRPTARVALQEWLARHAAKLRGNDSGRVQKQKKGAARGDFSEYGVEPCLPDGTFRCRVCGTTIKAATSDQPIIDHICSPGHDDTLREKGLTHKYYYAPGIALRDAERKASSGRKAYTTGKTKQ